MTKFGLFLLIFSLSLTSVSSQKIEQASFCSTRPTIDQINTSDPFSHANYQLIARYPHDTSAFTQGLVFYQKKLYESTGLLNQSVVRKINIKDGKSLVESNISDVYFGEGLALLNHQLIQMSWKSGKVFFFHPETLKLIKKQFFNQDVWGSTTVNNQLVISNGSSTLFFINPDNLNISTPLKVTFNNKAIFGLNELEYAEGYIYANVWPSTCIIKIDPMSGAVVELLNLSKLVPAEYQSSDSAVLNGIAYQKQNKHFFVTGKFWPFLYEIKWQSNEY